jgi:hypothetical protein
MMSFHAGYSFWWLFYASADAFVLPPFVIQNITAYTSDLYTVDGVYRPGFVTMLDFGFRPTIGPLGAMLEAGINTLYIYKQDELSENAYNQSVGFNARAGAYLFLNKNIAVTGTGTMIFSDIQSMISTFKALAGKDAADRQKAIDLIMGKFLPTIGLIIQF